ncbi:helix-turn-helix domain-containing protein [Vibrio mediterranei]|uniref:helix-turn-helix domain-containing protein n=1 Tax=Vibrio mediterranei TaxID=689 RepID=UPI00406790A1
MSEKESIVNKKEITTLVKQELEFAKDEKRVTPDMSWVMQLVRDTLVDEVLINTRGNVSKASRMLGINRGSCTRYADASRQRNW